jgi:hypothetical protein
MAIDKSGKWWNGATRDDALRYLRSLKPGGYTVDEVLPQRCECGSSVFRLYQNADSELSYFVCCGCETKTFVTDSEEFTEVDDFELTKCPCGSSHLRVFLGVHSMDDKSVANWISIGVICDECGVLGSPLDWELDTEKSERSYAKHTVPLPSKRSAQPRSRAKGGRARRRSLR